MNLENLNKEQLLELVTTLQHLTDSKKYNKFDFAFPDSGKYRREMYPKHISFFEAGARHSRRAFIAGNRVGKSFAGAYELVCHMTGKYPHWWTGRRFNRPIKAWAAAIENKQLREGIQELLFGDFSDKGTGIIPRDVLLDDRKDIQTWNMSGTANCVGTARMRHYTNGVFDGWSQIDFKTYEQGWQNFQGTKRDVIWLDEEPNDYKIYSECITRTAGDEGEEGILYCTFTPLLGFSTVVLGFLPNGVMPRDGIHPTNPEKWVVSATWDDCPHLSQKWKDAQLQEYSANERDARSKGIPALGSGRVYPIDEEFVVVRPFKIPSYWKKSYGLDPGWNATAAVWIAEDPATNVKYVYSEYKHGKVIDLIHADAIKRRGEWMQGAIDPHGAKHKRDDGTDKIDYFISLGLNLIPGNGDPTTGISKLLAQFESGALKIFITCEELLNEIRVYKYDLNDPNKIAKNQEDHLLDALRYADSRFDELAQSYCEFEEEHSRHSVRNHSDGYGKSDITGY